MYDCYEMVKTEINKMEKLLDISMATLGKRHVGALVVRVFKGNKYYYETWNSNGKVRQKYLGTASDERVGEFIIRKIIKKRIELLKANIGKLSKLKENLYDYSSEAILDLLGEKYQTAFWDAAGLDELSEADGHVAGSNAPETAVYENECSERQFQRTIITCDGHRVRSKGECIIYDLLTMNHIQFEYEPTLHLYNDDYNLVRIHPDFYIECKDGDHIIIEHLGLLNDQEYAEDQNWKIRMYHLNGYDLGHNLILTSDNEEGGIDSGFIADLIQLVILKRARTID